jgi:hypothetical protein
MVIWGEFGRTPMNQAGNDRRDHHPNAFTMWLAGGHQVRHHAVAKATTATRF